MIMKCKYGRGPDGKCRKVPNKHISGWGNPDAPGVTSQVAGLGEAVLRDFIKSMLTEIDLEKSLLYAGGEPEEGMITYGNDL